MKKLELNTLEEANSHYNNLTITGMITIDVPVFKNGEATDRFKTLKLSGEAIKVSVDEYKIHFKEIEI